MTPKPMTNANDRRSFLAATSAAAVSAFPCATSSVLAASDTEEVCYLTFTDLRKRLVRGELSLTEVLESYIQRFSRINPQINACIQSDFDAARAYATRCDKQLAGLRRSGDAESLPLLGLLFGTKDNLDVKNHPTSQGSPLLVKRIANSDSEAVKRFRGQGGFPIVKTNMPFMGMSHIDTTNSVFGATKNPRSLDRVPGGSSGGSAAAVAAGLSWIDIGADAGGSIRVPSALCGVYGLRPRPRLNKNLIRGMHPTLDSNAMGAYFLTVGPIARSVTDLRLVAPLFVEPEADKFQRRSVRGRRIAYFKSWGQDYVTPTLEIQGAIENAAVQLKNAGAIVDFEQPGFLSGPNTAQIALSSVFGIGLNDDRRSLMEEHGIAENDQLMREIDECFTKYPARRLGGVAGMEQHIKRLDGWRAKMNLFMDSIDALLLPLVSDVPPVRGSNYSNLETVEGFGTYPLVASIMDNLAAGGLSCSYTKEGLPLGIQVIAKTEATVLDVMETLEESSGGFQIPAAI